MLKHLNVDQYERTRLTRFYFFLIGRGRLKFSNREEQQIGNKFHKASSKTTTPTRITLKRKQPEKRGQTPKKTPNRKTPKQRQKTPKTQRQTSNIYHSPHVDLLSITLDFPLVFLLLLYFRSPFLDLLGLDR